MTALNKQAALRQLAEKAIGAYERLSAMPADEIFDISLHEGTQLDADITALNAFNESANPKTMLALLDGLEAEKNMRAAAERRIAELEAREVVLPSFPESTDWFQQMNMQAVKKMIVDAIRAAGIGVKGE